MPRVAVLAGVDGVAGATAYALYNILYCRWAPPFGQWINLYVQVLMAVVMLVPVAMTAHTLAVPAKGIGPFGIARPLVFFGRAAQGLAVKSNTLAGA